MIDPVSGSGHSLRGDRIWNYHSDESDPEIHNRLMAELINTVDDLRREVTDLAEAVNKLPL